MKVEVYGSVPLDSLAAAAEDEVSRVVTDSALALLTQIRRNASTGSHKPGAPHIPGTGPGPNVATGDYRRSWAVQTGRDATGAVVALVSTRSPQGPRLEYGFTDVDSLGRRYAQPPYPHVRPAVEQYRPRFEADMAAALARAVRRSQ